MELWELIARERIRDTLARYTWSGDSLRAEELAAAFCEDGELEVRGREPIRGRSAIAAFIAGVGRQPPAPAAGTGARRIVRHNVTNIRFSELEPERALVASYFTVLTEIGLDHHGRYRDTFVPVGDEWLIRHRVVSTDWRAEASTMAPPPARRSR
ncbi:MAG TPA: nuclear transport factor 2 family protein [Acidimicrobiales bacterium]|nr:nuclear transport factor 2 family protein [Acidimicrobiales bacterium]